MGHIYNIVWIIAGILTILGVGWRMGVVLGKTVEKYLSHKVREDVRDEVRNEVKTQMAPILKELSPNSGTSLRDRVVRLDEWRPHVENRLKNQDESLARIERRVDERIRRA